jgi:glycosyltransferase involved in cell wall biosynthesis
MNKKSITFLFHQPTISPVGGYKVVYEYANMLAADGYKVYVVYDFFYRWKNSSLISKFRQIFKYLLAIVSNHYSGRRWFNLNGNVCEKYVSSLRYCCVPKTDAYIATAAETSILLNSYAIENKRKGYLIQGYENWNMDDDTLRKTYHFGMSKFVISNWLKKILSEEGVDSILLPNGFNFDYFKLFIPIREKNKYIITMLNHTDERKGVKYGVAALAKVKKKYPQLEVNMFGVPERPVELPQWYHYYHRPDCEIHNRIYNEGAIFLATSLIEGWGLTVGEAMMCGEAVVCTDIDGFKEMVSNGYNALISPVKDSESLADNIITLIEHDDIRIKLATNGYESVQKFNWKDSYNKFRKTMNL